jgi:hypothetical protein
MEHITALALIMIVGGVIGGLGSYFASEVPADERQPIIKRIALGIAAALVVPLFLNMISSSILVNAEQTPTNYLVFAGFCIVAAFSSKTFLTSVSKRILDKVESVEQRQKELESEVEPIVAKETETEPEEEPARKLDVEVNQEEMAVLKALANPKYARRYASGVESETGFGDVKTVSLLHSLREKNLVRSKRGKRLDLFWLTSLGRDYLRSHGENTAMA